MAFKYDEYEDVACSICGSCNNLYFNDEMYAIKNYYSFCSYDNEENNE